MADTDLKVIIKAKELMKHTYKLTSNTNRYPKKYCHSLVDRMQCSKIFRPEVEIEFVGVKGFIAALIAICKVGLIKKAPVNCQIKTFSVQSHGFEGGTIKRIPCYIIPKYRLKKVKK